MTWHEYSAGTHRGRMEGYPNPLIAQSAGQDMAVRLSRVCNDHGWERQSIIFVVADGSSAVIGAHTFVEFGAGRIVAISKAHCDDEHEQMLCYTLQDMEEEDKLVFCDDYICCGGSVRHTSQILKRPIDLFMVIKCSPNNNLEFMLWDKKTSPCPAARLVSILDRGEDITDLNHLFPSKPKLKRDCRGRFIGGD